MSCRTENLKAVDMSGLEIRAYLKNTISFSPYNIRGKGRYREFSLASELKNKDLDYGIKFINRFRSIYEGEILFRDNHRDMCGSFYSPYDNVKSTTFEVINPNPFDNNTIKQIFIHIELFKLRDIIDIKIEDKDCKCCLCGESESDEYFKIRVSGKYEALCQRCNDFAGNFHDYSSIRRVEYVVTNNAKVRLESLVYEKLINSCIRDVNNYCKKWGVTRKKAYNFIEKSGIFKHKGKISNHDLICMHKHFKTSKFKSLR